jgi:replicative DNA helicase
MSKQKPIKLLWEQFPTNITCERAIIALVLFKHEYFTRIVTTLKLQDFIDTSAQFIFKILLKYHDNQTTWSWQHIADAISTLEDRPSNLEYPHSYIAELLTEKARIDDINFHIDQIINLRIRKQIVQQISVLQIKIQDPTVNLIQIADAVKDMQHTINEQQSISTQKEVSKINIVSTMHKEIEEIRQSNFVGTGFDSIDNKLTWGLHTGQVSIICGRPSQGKSTLRSNIQVNLSKQGIGNICISREQSIFAEYCRIIAIHTQTSLTDLIKVREWEGNNQFTAFVEEELKHIEQNWPIRIVEPIGSYYLADIRDNIATARSSGENPKVLFIDLFSQLDDVNVATNTPQVIQTKVMECAALAKQLKIHICLVVHLRRFGDARAKKKTNLFDLREYLKGSGSFEERADMIFAVERPGYSSEEDDDSVMQVLILKQKDGPTPLLQLSFDRTSLALTDDIENITIGKKTLDTDDTLSHLDET